MIPVDDHIKAVMRPRLWCAGIPVLEQIERVIRSIFVVIRNFFIYCLGGSSANDKLKAGNYDPEDLVFRNFFDIFNVRKGFYDHPSQVRKWQIAVEENRNRRIDELRNSNEYASLSDQMKREREDQIRFSIPSQIANKEMDFTL